MTLEATAPTEALLSMDGYQIVTAGWTQPRDLLFSHVSEVTQKPRSVILMDSEVGNNYPLPTIKTKHC